MQEISLQCVCVLFQAQCDATFVLEGDKRPSPAVLHCQHCSQHWHWVSQTCHKTCQLCPERRACKLQGLGFSSDKGTNVCFPKGDVQQPQWIGLGWRFGNSIGLFSPVVHILTHHTEGWYFCFLIPIRARSSLNLKTRAPCSIFKLNLTEGTILNTPLSQHKSHYCM